MSGLQIRPMCREDIPQVAELDEMCFSVPWSAASLEGELDNELADWLVADLDGTIAGYVGAQTVLDEADLMNLAVHPGQHPAGLERGGGKGSFADRVSAEDRRDVHRRI